MYVNQSTGEVYENRNELVTRDVNELTNLDEMLDMMAQMEMLQEKMDVWKFQHKEKIKELCKKYDLKTISNDYVTISFIDEHTQKRVDTKKLKDAGLYDEFCTEVKVSESVRIARKK